MNKNSALIVVDMQNDFVSGSLAVNGADKLAPYVNTLVSAFITAGASVVATQDWHPTEHCSFETKGGPWPVHCVADSWGSALIDDLRTKDFAAIIRKGMQMEVDSYSGFLDNDRQTATGLSGYLRSRGVEDVYVCGIALDFCVSWTAQDSLNEGFRTFIVDDLCVAIDRNAWTPPDGVTMISSNELLIPVGEA